MTADAYIASTLAIALARGAQLSPAAVSQVLLALPMEHGTTARWAADWYNNMTHASILSDSDMASAQKVLDQTLKANIFSIPINSVDYPSYLRLIESAPPVLYVKGNIDLLHSAPGVAVVGTRRASSTGLTIAKRIAEYFSEAGWTIVSGLALGIDAAAHAGALSKKRPTIAVLAHGLKSASPKANSNLAAEILHNNGAWMSEYPVDVSARPEQFVLRNRIQIGLSAGSFIVEGEERSGTMTQAEYCLRNKRHLFAVLPDRFKELKLVSAGPEILISKRGATRIRSRDDYITAMLAMQTVRDGLAAVDTVKS